MTFVIVSDKFPDQPGFDFIIAEPCYKFSRVHIGNWNHNFRKTHNLAVDGIRYSVDRNSIGIRDKFARSTPVEVGVHAPFPVRNTTKRGNRIRRRNFNILEQSYPQTNRNSERQKRCSRVAHVRIIPDLAKRFVCRHIKNNILHISFLV